MAVAVNVTGVPAQTFVKLAPILNDGVPFEFTVMVMEFEVAVDVVMQVELDVITQFTTCPFVSEEVVSTELFVPALVPFTFH